MTWPSGDNFGAHGLVRQGGKMWLHIGMIMVVICGYHSMKEVQMEVAMKPARASNNNSK